MPIGSPAVVLARQYLTSDVPNPATNVETVIATFPGLQQGAPPVINGVPVPAPVRVSGIYNVAPGAATTQIVLRLRQGTTTADVLVGTAETFQPVTATDPVSVPFGFQDNTGYLQQESGGGGLPYVITAQQTSATDNGTSNTFEAEVSA